MKKQILLLLLMLLSFSCFAQNSFTVNAATYLATDSIDEVNGVDVAPDGTIYVAGKLPDYTQSGASVYQLLGGGKAVVARFNKTGDQLLSVTRIKGNTINDLQINDNGDIAITGSFGVGVLNAGGASFKWFDTTIAKGTVTAHSNSFYGWFNVSTNRDRYKRAMSRVSIGSDGTTATIQQIANYGSSYLYVYNSSGTLIYDSIFPPTTKKVFPDRTFTSYNINVYPLDICVDGTNKSVIIAGWNPRMDTSVYQPDHPIHMPYIKCFAYNGTLKWDAYDWRAKDVYDRNRYADSRFNDIILGRDGFLYTAGYIHGGDHMFLFDSHTFLANSNAHFGYDNYSNAVTMGSGIDHAYFCKYDPLNGNQLKGQAAIVRKKTNGTDKPNQSQIKGLMVDESGKLYMAGYCQPYIKNRSLQTINGIAVGLKDTCEAFIMIVNPDWSSREIWTVVTKDKLEGTFWGLGYRNGVVATAGEVFGGQAITSTNAIQSTRKANYDGYLITWGLFTESKEVSSELIKNDITIYPTLTNGIITIKTSSITSVTITNSIGQQIKTLNINNQDIIQVDLSNEVSGMFFIKINNGINTRIEKIIKY